MDKVYTRANLTAIAARKKLRETEAAKLNAELEAWKSKWVESVELAAAEGFFPNVTLFMTIEPNPEFLADLGTPHYQVTYQKCDEFDYYSRPIHGWKLYLTELPVLPHQD